MYKLTTMANSKLSNQRANTIVVPKPSQDYLREDKKEQRVIFGYYRVNKDIPIVVLNLTNKLYNLLANPRVRCFI